MRYFAKEITIASGANAGLDSKKVVFDPAYKTVTGVALYVVNDGGLTSFDVALRDQGGKYLHDPTDKNDWQPIAGERYKPVEIDISTPDMQFVIDTITPGSPQTDLKYQLVFVLEK